MSAATMKQAGNAVKLRQLKQTKAIKACQRQLGMDDDTYRAMLLVQTGGRASSATQLTLAEGAKVLDYLRRQGAVNPNRPDTKRRPTPSADRAPMMAKVHALLTELGKVTGEPHGMAYADAICRRNRWADAVDFMRPIDLHLLVGALSRTLRTRQANAAQAQATQPARVEG